VNNGDTTVNCDMLQNGNGDNSRNFVGGQFWDKMANNGKIFYTNASSLALPAGTVQVFINLVSRKSNLAMNLANLLVPKFFTSECSRQLLMQRPQYVVL
jgi:hypothetical protein